MTAMRPASRIDGKPPLEWDTITQQEAELLASIVGDDRPGWHWSAACAFSDPNVFFPGKGGSTKEAKRICDQCPVRTECLADALAHDERFGVFGGLSERERRKLKPPYTGPSLTRGRARAIEVRRLAAEGVALREIAERFEMHLDAVRRLLWKPKSELGQAS